MASKREQILAALKTTLAGTTGVSTRIYRSRIEPITNGESPAIVIEPITDEPSTNNSSYLKIDWTLRVRIVVIIRGTVPDSVGDPTVESLFTKVLTDPTVGGLAKDIRPATQTFEVLEADTPAGLITCEFEIDYRTSYNSLST
tara:strand:+ start:1143 stop:1571 length:429 start_codon:yes stop_codon:yes gene_type:complete